MLKGIIWMFLMKTKLKWMEFWDNVNLPLLKRIKNKKRRKTVWRLNDE